ncbi:hypothetical protein [Acetobacterium malicum]|nr:hypothetical protein [Acetobacterium dehalogenans]
MAVFMAKRIISGKNNYTEVVSARPDLKAAIDEYLIAEGHGDLIVAA